MKEEKGSAQIGPSPIKPAKSSSRDAALERLKKRVYTLSRELASVMRERDAAPSQASPIGWPNLGSSAAPLPLKSSSPLFPPPFRNPWATPLPHNQGAPSFPPSGVRFFSSPGKHDVHLSPSEGDLISAVPVSSLQYMPAAHRSVPVPLGVSPYILSAQSLMAGLGSPGGPQRYHKGSRRTRAHSVPASRGGSPIRRGYPRFRQYPGGPNLRGSWAGLQRDRGPSPNAVRRSRSLAERPEWLDSTSRSALAASTEADKLKHRLVIAERGRAQALAAANAGRKAVEQQLAVRPSFRDYLHYEPIGVISWGFSCQGVTICPVGSKIAWNCLCHMCMSRAYDLPVHSSPAT